VIVIAAHELYIAGIKKPKDENEIWQLKDFEREGTKRYLYTKRCEEERDNMSKTADTTLHNRLSTMEKKAARTMQT